MEVAVGVVRSLFFMFSMNLGMFHIIMLVLHNVAMDMNNVMEINYHS